LQVHAVSPDIHKPTGWRIPAYCLSGAESLNTKGSHDDENEKNATADTDAFEPHEDLSAWWVFTRWFGRRHTIGLSH
jgi:hypothetical protein